MAAATCAADFKPVTPYATLAWLSHRESILLTYFLALLHRGEYDPGEFWVRAIVMLIAGYPSNAIVHAAMSALSRCDMYGAALVLRHDWLRNHRLPRWEYRPRASAAATNEHAFIHRLLCERDARIRWDGREAFCILWGLVHAVSRACT